MLTADRIALAATQDPQATKAALVALASGSQKLLAQTDVNTFMDQEADISGFFGFVSELYATHPRLTLRVREIERFVTRRMNLVA